MIMVMARNENVKHMNMLMNFSCLLSELLTTIKKSSLLLLDFEEILLLSSLGTTTAASTSMESNATLFLEAEGDVPFEVLIVAVLKEGICCL